MEKFQKDNLIINLNVAIIQVYCGWSLATINNRFMWECQLKFTKKGLFRLYWNALKQWCVFYDFRYQKWSRNIENAEWI